MLVDEEGAEEVKDKGIRAFKRRKRQEAFASVEIVSFEGTQIVELQQYPTAKAARDTGEGFSEVATSSFGIVAKLMEATMTSKSCFENLKTFNTFAGAISSNLDVFKITINRAKNSFFFSFRSLNQVGYSPPSLLFVFFFQPHKMLSVSLYILGESAL